MLKSVSQRTMQRIETRLHYLYGDQAHSLANRLFLMIGRYGVGVNGYRQPEENGWDQSDIALITYGDMIRTEGEPPLKTLRGFLTRRIGRAIKTVHILPFFPYTSDDGFSVKDYRVVDPALGTWPDILALRQDYRLMFDLVINHVSRQSTWFKDYVNDIAPYRHFFHEVEPGTDLSQVVRPRSLPLLSETWTRAGTRHVWTTFSSDQVDLNFANPEVLFEFIDILFWYISKGARIIRLDAIAYLWKIIGTPCIHLTQTHEVVKLLRDVLDMVAPDVWLITETNVPHEENISYFGDADEAHMVYQFSLPPLLAHGLLTGYAGHLTRWAESLPALGPNQTYFNFTASHDGVGVRPLRGLISDEDFGDLLKHVERMGGRISHKANSDGSESPYELNITYFDLLGDSADQVSEAHVARFMTSQAVMLAMQGMPAVYINSLLGARNAQAAVQTTGHNRAINREKWSVEQLDNLLGDHSGHHQKVFAQFLHLLNVRKRQPAFHPHATQQIVHAGDTLFAIIRRAPDDGQHIVSLSNFAATPTTVRLDERFAPLHEVDAVKDLIREEIQAGRRSEWVLAPYQTRWLTIA